MNERKKFLVVEGQTGSGKGTFIRQFLNYNSEYEPLPEIHQFMVAQNTGISKYDEIYDQQNTYVCAHISRYKLINNSTKAYLIERDFVSQVVYSMTCAKLKGWTNIFPLFQLLQEQITNLLLPLLYVYIDCNSKIALSRKICRGSSRLEGIPSWCSGDLINVFELERSRIYKYIFTNVDYPVFLINSNKNFGENEFSDIITKSIINRASFSTQGEEISKFISSLEELSRKYLTLN